MTSTGPDFDPRNSDLQVGIELEYPIDNPDTEYLVHRGVYSQNLQRQLSSRPSGLHDAECVYDGTVGLEIVSDVLDLADMESWYAHAIDWAAEQHEGDYQPTGLMDNGNTAGTHIHISNVNTRKARELYELSQTSWARVLFCSSVAKGITSDSVEWPVFRGGSHCRTGFDESRYSCVNQRGRGHIEWRLPEPMVPEHMELVAEFLARFEEDTDLAIEYAQERLNEADERITSIQRAEAVGMDIEGMPEIYRERASADPEDFFDALHDNWLYPEIYTVEINEGTFYAFESDINDTIEVSSVGVEFHPDDVLWADSLETVHDDGLAQQVRNALSQRNSGSARETEATDELKEIVKKKKGLES